MDLGLVLHLTMLLGATASVIRYMRPTPSNLKHAGIAMSDGYGWNGQHHVLKYDKYSQ